MYWHNFFSLSLSFCTWNATICELCAMCTGWLVCAFFSIFSTLVALNIDSVSCCSDTTKKVGLANEGRKKTGARTAKTNEEQQKKKKTLPIYHVFKWSGKCAKNQHKFNILVSPHLMCVLSRLPTVRIHSMICMWAHEQANGVQWKQTIAFGTIWAGWLTQFAFTISIFTAKIGSDCELARICIAIELRET